jgi:hypothetical protein
MSLIPIILRLLVLQGLALMLIGCPGTITVQIAPTQPTPPAGLLSSVPPVRIKVANFVDKREGNPNPILIGRRQAAFGVPMGEVYSERPVFETVTEAIKSELRRNGHNIVKENEDFALQGEIRHFWVKTDVTLLYWDVVGEITVTMEVNRPGQQGGGILGPYNGRKVERTYINPGEGMMKRVLTASLNSVIQQIGSDPKLVSELDKRQRR